MNKLASSTVFLLLVLGLLAIPLPEGEPVAQEPSTPFVWNQDVVWDSLEQTFIATRNAGCESVTNEIEFALDSLAITIDSIDAMTRTPADPLWDSLERKLFPAAARVAACPEQAAELGRHVNKLRADAKRQSIDWDLNTVEARHQLYRLLYGSRTALEEVIVQGGDSTLALFVDDNIEPPATPSAEVLGVRIHSGDMLVSRGGYPTSALISRGSDYPGNFSHVALAHVDDDGTVSVIEAHISVGVTVSPAEKYLADKKLRLMVLRLRSDHPLVEANPMLPHQAAEVALGRASTEHIPYDFEMDYENHDRLFCSEVASSAYGQVGVTLWTGISTISRPGLRDWLAAFGVRYFETQEPSDLEYDPQLKVVAEWRDLATLKQDRVDNAVVDAMLEGADEGTPLTYPWYELPVGRLAKGYSAGINAFGGTGPIPEGMSTPAALRNKSYTKLHGQFAVEVTDGAESFARTNGYEPPYWQLVALARTAVGSTPAQ